jgi:hypothetical protein
MTGVRLGLHSLLYGLRIGGRGRPAPLRPEPQAPSAPDPNRGRRGASRTSYVVQGLTPRTTTGSAIAVHVRGRFRGRLRVLATSQPTSRG